MSITQLFFKKGNFIDTIELDVIIEESASASARLTKNPVEKGADVNDHIIVDPMTFSLSGLVSNANVNVLDSVAGLFDLGRYTGATSPAKDAWNDLLELHASKTPFTLVQGLKSYRNAVLLSLVESQNKDTSKGLFFNASFAILNIVGDQAITVQQFNENDVADQAILNIKGGLKQLL